MRSAGLSADHQSSFATEQGLPSPRRSPRSDALVGEVGSVARLWLNRTLPACFREHFSRTDLELIDVGCGAGPVAKQLAEADASGSYLGVDLAARPEWRRPFDGRLAVEFAELDARDVGALARRFNAATAIMSFEHVEDDRAVLGALASSLADGGVALLAVPAPGARWYLGRRHCYRWYRREDIEALADVAKLDVVSIATRRSSAGLLVDGSRYALFTGIARALRAAVYLRHGGDREAAFKRSPWIRDVHTRLNDAWVTLAGGRLARSLAQAAYRLDDVLPGLDVAHVAVLRKRSRA